MSFSEQEKDIGSFFFSMGVWTCLQRRYLPYASSATAGERCIEIPARESISV